MSRTQQFTTLRVLCAKRSVARKSIILLFTIGEKTELEMAPALQHYEALMQLAGIFSGMSYILSNRYALNAHDQCRHQ